MPKVQRKIIPESSLNKESSNINIKLVQKQEVFRGDTN